MSNTILRYKMFFSFEKEEAWLESMSKQGWHLQKVSGICYQFVQGEPEDRIWKIDFRNLKKGQDVSDYVALFEDSGWTCVSARVCGYNYYFYTASQNPEKDIFSDEDSRAQRYLRFAQYFGMSFVPSLLPFLALYLNGTIRVGNFGYLTPGLWQMKGWEFVSHFLFETPFVLMRGGAGLLPMVILLAALFYALRFYFVYRKMRAAI